MHRAGDAWSRIARVDVGPKIVERIPGGIDEAGVCLPAERLGSVGDEGVMSLGYPGIEAQGDLTQERISRVDAGRRHREAVPEMNWLSSIPVSVLINE